MAGEIKSPAQGGQLGDDLDACFTMPDDIGGNIDPFAEFGAK